MGLEITIKGLNHHHPIKLIGLKGELDFLGSKKLAQEVLPIIAEGSFYLIMDLHELDYINNTGIYGLLRCFSKVKEKGGFLKFVAINQRIKEILDMAGIMRFICIYDTLDEALMDTEGG